MTVNYIPSFFKDKIILIFNHFFSILSLLFSVFLILSLYSFNIEDNSFLTNSSNSSSNIFGDLGSYIASFIFYTFGLTGYLFVTFFLSYSIFCFQQKRPKFFFLRLVIFSICLLFMPQIFFIFKFNINFIDSIDDWGIFSKKLYQIHQQETVGYILTFIGTVGIFLTQNLFFKKFPNFKVSKINLKKDKEITKLVKKEPIINKFVDIKADISNNLINKDKNTKIDDQFSSPSLDILSKNESSNSKLNSSTIKKNSDELERVFSDFNIKIDVINAKQGPVITLYEILPAPGIKINSIINLAGDISRSMGVGAVRISQVYGTQYLGVEIPNEYRETVTIRDLLGDINFKNSSHKIPICIGKDISGKNEVIDLSKAPHLLVAGTTGSGKSVFINTLLTSLLYKFSPKELRLILIDPKMLELSVYNDIAHLLTPVVTEPKKSIIALKWVCKEMERRYSMMNEQNTRNLEGYNDTAVEKMPYIVVVIDEMADLMMTAGKEVEHYVQRLAQMARACGIHLVMATQRPSVDIITGSIKANFPSRISFQVASKYDSRTVLGEIGAEQLLGNGDMLMSKNGANIIRYQSAFISDNEVNKLISEIKRKQKVDYLDELEQIIKNNDENFDTMSEEDEELISKSIDLIKNTNKASTSFLQRNFQIGYNKAARIMEALEQRGVVSEPNHTGKREILINNI